MSWCIDNGYDCVSTVAFEAIKYSIVAKYLFGHLKSYIVDCIGKSEENTM